jgi:hypothetical protein
LWIEAILTNHDCAEFIASITPLTIELDGPGRVLVVDPPTHVELVPTKGLRLAAAGHVSWSLGSLKLPVHVRVGSLLLTPTVETIYGRDALCFRVRVEHLDVKALPDFIDETLIHRINDTLARHDDMLVWRFAEALDRHVILPRRVESTDAVDIRVKWGELRITASALVLAMSLDVHAATSFTADAAE